MDGCLERHARLKAVGNEWVSREACWTGGRGE